MPTVLVVVKGLGLGGAERLVAESVVHAITQDERYRYEVAYVLPWKDQLVTRLTSSGVPTTCIGGPGGSLVRAGRRIRSMSRRFDLVHAHLPATGILARVLSSAPVIYTEHNIASSYRQPTRLLNRITYGRNTAVTAVSDAVQQSLIGYPGPTPITVRNGVAVDDISGAADSVREEFGIGAEQRLVVHIGNIRPHKGHENLIRATNELAQRAPDVMVLSAGTEKHPGDVERLEALASSQGIDHRIRFLGRRDDAHRLIAAADLLVNPSDVEGLPVVILEAMMLGTPVVATDVGGVSTVIQDAVTGWLVPARDPSALADAVQAALDSPAKRARCVEAARTLVEADYGIGRMVCEFEDLYDRILG